MIASVAVSAALLTTALAGCQVVSKGSASAPASASSSTLDIDRLTTMLHSATEEASKYWPGYDLSKTVVHFSDGKRVWDLSGKNPKEVKDPALLETAGPIFYNFDRTDGVNKLEMKVDKSTYEQIIKSPESPYDAKLPIEEFSVNVLLHEAFHAFAQDPNARFKDCENGGCPTDWALDDLPSSQRVVDLPLATDPRVLRYRLFDSLRSALTDRKHQKTHLANAAYYAQEYAKKYPAEAADAMYPDIVEGSAEYVGQRAMARATAGANADDDAVLAAAVKELSTPYRATSAYAESYKLGVVAGLLLDQLKVAGWKERVSKGETPVQVLLTDVKPESPATVSPSKEEESMLKNVKVISDKNTKFADDFVEQYAAKGPLLAVPYDSIDGSFQSDAEASIASLPANIHVQLNTTAGMKFAGETLNIAGKSIGVTTDDKLCGRQVYLIPEKDLPKKIDSYAGTTTTDADGRAIRCVTE